MSIEQNKQAVVAYLEQALNAKQPADAVAAYVGSRYIQHNPQAPDGPEAFIAFVNGFSEQFPPRANRHQAGRRRRGPRRDA